VEALGAAEEALVADVVADVADLATAGVEDLATAEVVVVVVVVDLVTVAVEVGVVVRLEVAAEVRAQEALLTLRVRRPHSRHLMLSVVLFPPCLLDLHFIGRRYFNICYAA